MKKIVDDTFLVFGMVFVFLLIASYFLPIGKIIEDGRAFLLIFFILNVVGKYLLNRKEKKTNNKIFIHFGVKYKSRVSSSVLARFF